MHLKSESGYTVIELLIVGAIIGVLTSLAIANFSSQRQRATLTVVKADLKNVSTSLESYHAAHLVYPANLQALSPNEMVVVPTQPKGNGSYRYCEGADGKSYELDTNENEYGPTGDTTEMFVVSGSGVTEGDGTADSC